jgi:hypothetical protein
LKKRSIRLGLRKGAGCLRLNLDEMQGRGLFPDQHTGAVAIICLVARTTAPGLKRVEQAIRHWPVMRLPLAPTEPDRQPLHIDDDMDLGRERGGTITCHSKSVRSYRLILGYHGVLTFRLSRRHSPRDADLSCTKPRPTVESIWAMRPLSVRRNGQAVSGTDRCRETSRPG